MPSVTLQLCDATEEVLRERARQWNQTLEAWLENIADREAQGGLDPLEVAVRAITMRTDEQVLADRELALRNAWPARPVPEGKTLDDMVKGKWPGDETDEQIRVALKELS